MTKYTQYSALLFLVIFTAYLASGVAIKGVNYYASVSESASVWKTTCQQSTHIVHISLGDKAYSTNRTLPSKDQRSVELTNCSTSLQILPAGNSFLLEPSKNKQQVFLRSNFLSSQNFIYQEPDPPRFI